MIVLKKNKNEFKIRKEIIHSESPISHARNFEISSEKNSQKK